MQHFKRNPKSCLEDNSGAVALEFALVVPFLFMFYLAAVATFDATRAAHQSSQVTRVLADLSTRVIDMTDEKRDALFNTGNALLTKWDDGSSYTISLTSIINPIEGDDEPEIEKKVAWSEATIAGNEVTDADLDKLDIPSIKEGDSLILVKINGSYSPMFSIMGSSTDFEIIRSSVRRPRFVSEVLYLEN